MPIHANNAAAKIKTTPTVKKTVGGLRSELTANNDDSSFDGGWGRR